MSEVRDPLTDQPLPEPNDLPSMHDLAVDLLGDRKAHGLRKYGSLLQPDNGRSFSQDAVEEAADLLVYMLGKKWEDDNPDQTWLGQLCWMLIVGDDQLDEIDHLPPVMHAMVTRMFALRDGGG